MNEDNGDPFGVNDPKPDYSQTPPRANPPRNVWDLPIAGYFWKG